MLVLHIVNSIFCYLILKNITNKTNDLSSSLICCILTLFWAFHPVNIEPVLFGTNFGILITFLLCFILFYYFQKVELPVKNYTVHFSFVFITYLLAFSLHEYAFVLPIILFTYLLWKDIVIENKPRKVAIAHTLRLLLPILVVFLCCFDQQFYNHL